MKAHTLVPHPMTPPDDPPEPNLSLAMVCPKCGFMPDWESRLGTTEYRLLCTHHLYGAWADDIDKAVDYWNADVEQMQRLLRPKGEQLKVAGQSQVADHNEAWIGDVLMAIAHFASRPDTFTVQQVRNFCSREGFPAPKSPNAWGAAFSVAAKQGLIVRVGYQKNSLPSAHARVVAVWCGAKASQESSPQGQ